MKFLLRRINQVAGCAAVVALAAIGSTSANAYVYQFSDVFEGTAPEGTPPWINVSIADLSTPGVVQLTISAAGMTTAESLESLLLNFNPSENPSKLSFTPIGSTGTFMNPVITEGANNFKADGDGKYDIDLSFSTKAGKIFSTGDSITFDITSSTYGSSLDAADFDFLSKPSANGAGPFLAAAEFQCTTTPSIREWVAPSVVATPEPGTFSLLGIGAAGLGAARWFRRRQQRDAR
jgi:hypothetical protein